MGCSSGSLLLTLSENVCLGFGRRMFVFLGLGTDETVVACLLIVSQNGAEVFVGDI